MEGCAADDKEMFKSEVEMLKEDKEDPDVPDDQSEKENNLVKESPTSVTPDTNSSFEDLRGEYLSHFDGPKPERNEDGEEVMDVLGSGGLMKKIVVKGKSDTKRPVRGDLCTIRLHGKLEDGTVVEDFPSLEVQVGDLEVVAGLDLIVPLMEVGEVSQVKVEPRLAYGDIGRFPDIPPNADIHYEIELIDARPETEPKDLAARERKSIGNKKRERGNFWYLRNECNYAIQCYRRALDYLDESEGGISEPTETGDLAPTNEELQDLLNDRMKVNNNIAAAQMKMEMYDAALKSVNNVLQCQPDNVKALFRKAKILIAQKEVTDASQVLKKALAIDPTNQAIQQEFQKLQALAQTEREKEKLLAKRMIRGADAANDDEKKKKKSSSTRLRRLILIWAPIFGLIGIGIAAIAAYRMRANV